MKNKQLGVAIPTLDPAIDTSMVQNTRSIDIPPAAPFTDVKGMLGEIESATAQFTQAQERKAKAAQETEQGSLTDLLRQQLGTPSQAELQNQAYGTEGGVNDINMELATLQGDIMKEQHSLTRRLQALEKNPEGLFGGALQQEMNRVERESLAKQADLYVIQQGVQGRFDAAKSAADRAIQARMAYDQRLIDVRQTIYDRNKDLFDKTEQRAFEAKQQELQTTVQEKQNQLQQISDLSLNALQNGAPSNIAAQMRSAKTVEEAMRIGGQYVGLMDRQLQNANLANINSQIAQRTQQAKEMNFANRKNALDLAQQGDPEAIKFLGYDPSTVQGGVKGAQRYEAQKTDIQMGIDAANRILGNKQGMGLTTGAFQSPALASLITSVGGGTAAGAGIGLATSGVGAIPGAAVGFVTGLATTPFTYSKFKTAKDETLAAASFLVNDVTFQSIRDLRAQGVTFGNMTEGERIAAGRAASQLASASITAPDGSVTGFRGSEDTIRQYVQDILRAYEGRQEYLDIQYGVTTDEQDEAELIWNQ